MNSKNLCGHLVLLSCFATGLVGGILSLNMVPPQADENWTKVKIGSWGWHRCKINNDCPGNCIEGSDKGTRYNLQTGQWEFIDLTPGTSGCTLTGSYKTCGNANCYWLCADSNNKCGIKATAQDYVQSNGIGVHLCSSANQIPCAKGCN